MPPRTPMFLALFTGAASVGWTYLAMRLEFSGVWGGNPNNAVRLAIYALPYLVLAINLLTCLRRNRTLLVLGLFANLAGLVLAAGWFSAPKGIVPGAVVLAYELAWYAYAADALRGPKHPATRIPFKV